MKQRRHAQPHETATALALSTDEQCLVIEALRIAHDTLCETADGLERRFPASSLIERLRVSAEQMTAVRQKLETA